MKYTFVLSHGFGFSSSFWDGFRKELERERFVEKIIVWEQGYFGADPVCPLPLGERCVGVGHSLGLCQLLKRKQKWHALVSVNGFTNFLSAKKGVYEQRQYELRKFTEMFFRDSKMTLKIFYDNCGYKGEHLEGINEQRLAQCLAMMSESFSLTAPTLALYEREDRVVPYAVTKDNFYDHPQAVCRQISGQSHVLPLHSSSDILFFLREFLLYNMGQSW